MEKTCQQTAQNDTEGQNQEAERSLDAEGQKLEGVGADRVGLGEVEIVNAVGFSNPKEVLDHMPITSDVEVKKQRIMNYRLNLN